MKDIEKKIEIAEILALHLLGKTNEAQQKRILEWLAEDKKNKALLEELEASGDLKIREEFIKSIDEGENWKGFVKKARKPFRINVFFRYAAILLPILLGGYWFLQKETFPLRLQIAKNYKEIAPGEKKAQLRLQSGEIIELSDADVLMVNQDSTLFVENKDRTLNYAFNNTLKETEERKTVFHELFVARGQEYHMVLSDGTEVWLNSESYLKYPVAFKGERREVTLKGEGFFKVTKNQNCPFIVKTQVMDIKVLGTEFNVVAYSKESQWQTTLVSGKVAALLHNEENTLLELSPNQQLTYDEEQVKYVLRTVDASQLTAWRDGFFVFEDAKLESICTKLSRWYDVSFFFQNKEAQNYQFSGKLPRFEDCETVLSLIEKTTSIKFTVKNNSITVSTTN